MKNAIYFMSIWSSDAPSKIKQGYVVLDSDRVPNPDITDHLDTGEPVQCYWKGDERIMLQPVELVGCDGVDLHDIASAWNRQQRRCPSGVLFKEHYLRFFAPRSKQRGKHKARRNRYERR